MSKIVEQARAMAKQVRFEDSEHIPNTNVFKESADLIDTLAAEVEKLEAESTEMALIGVRSVADVLALREKLAAVEKDAVRYQFVRQADGFLLDRIADMSTDGSEFDDAVDAAMQEATK